MSLVPLLRELTREVNDFYRPCSRDLFHDDLGMGMNPHDMVRIVQVPRHYRIQKELSKLHRSAKISKDGYQATVDVKEFEPKELSVKTVENFIVIEGKHEEKEDEHGSISRHFVRKFKLPKRFDPKDVTTTLSSDGILTVKAPFKSAEGIVERVVEIQQTGPARHCIKDDAKKDAKDKDDVDESN